MRSRSDSTRIVYAPPSGIASSWALPAWQNMSVTVGRIPSLAITACRCPQFNPDGFARCTVAPCSCNRSTSQYQPYVDHHLRLRARLGDRRRDHHRIVRHPDTRELLARRVHPHDHRPTAMKVDPDILSIHRASSSSRGLVVRTPSLDRLGSL